ncbi:EMIL3 protein, partial [Pomatorhinus ruficollis]|nr:EMIL3 protein [Pomatorhinus ruficollis]
RRGALLACLSLGTLLALADAKGAFYPPAAPLPYGGRYSLYTAGSSPQLGPGKPVGKHKSYCAYVVQRNVTCTLQDGAESYVKAEYHKCSWGPKCPGKVLYRTFFRPKYKIGYKTVTELSWRCCPGFMGEGCHDSPTDQPGLLPQHPSPKMPPGQKMFPVPRLPPYPKSHPDLKLPGLFGDRLDRLEEEVRRLSQSYDSLHTMVSGLGDRLRLAIQEDTTKMIGSLMNSPGTPDSSVGFGIIPDGLVDVADKADMATYPPVGEILTKVTEVSDVLKTKADLLHEVRGMVLDHDGQIKHLLESTRPSPLTSIDLLEEYVDTRLSNLRNLFEGRFEDLEARLNATEGETGSCCSSIEDSMKGTVVAEVDGMRTAFEDKMQTLEDRFMTIVGELNNVSSPMGMDGAVVPVLEGELASMRKRTDETLEALQNRLITLESTCSLGCTSASKDVETFRMEIEDCQNKNQDLLLRMDSNYDLLRKLNATILEIQRRIEEEASGALQGEITLLKINLNTVSKSLTGLKDSVSQYSDTMMHVNSSLDEHERKIEDEVHSIQEKVNDQGSQLFFSNRRVLNLKGDLERLKARIVSDLSSCKNVAHGLQQEVSHFDERVARVESACGRLGAIPGSLGHIREELEKHTGSLWDYMDHVNGTLAAHSQEITGLKDNLLDCQAKVSELAEQVGHLEEK